MKKLNYLYLALMVFSLFCFGQSETIAQATGTLKIEAAGPSSVVFHIDTVNKATGFRVEYKEDGGTYAEITVFDDQTVMGSYLYLTHKGLSGNTKYFYKLIPTDAGGDGVESIDSIVTYSPENVIHHSFESATDSKVTDLVTSGEDTLVNATVKPSGLTPLGNALSLEPVIVPGGIIDQPSTLYLVNSVIPLCTENVYNQANPYETRINGYRFTENSYSFWFKNSNADLAKAGAALASFGGHGSNAVFLYNDSIGVSIGNRYKTPANTDVAVSAMAPFASGNTDWHHAVFVFDHGITKLYLNGTLVASIDDSDKYQFTDMQLRLSDNWASFNLGSVYSWNRSLSGSGLITGTGYSNQFAGMMDEFKMFSYALSEQEISDMANEFAPDFSIKLEAAGPTSLVLRVDTTSAAGATLEYEVMAEGGEYAVISEFAATDVMGSYAYHTIGGLENGTFYSVKVTATDPVTGFSASKTESLATFTPGMIIHHDFESAADGKVTDLVTSGKDSLANASVAASGIAALGNALSLEPTVLPGGIIDQASSLFLINSVIPLCTENVYNQSNTYKARINGYRYTENSYSFWFKNSNAELARAGAALASFGGHGSNAIFLYNDSIGVSVGNRFKTPGNTDIAITAMAPLGSDNTDWNHAVYVFDHGVTKLYLNGTLVASIDDSDMYQFTDVQIRLSDNWGSFNLGSVYWWNRSLSGTLITDGDYSNQFAGMMDDFKMFNYALSEQEIADMAGAFAPEFSIKLEAAGPTSLVLRVDTAAAEVTLEYEIMPEGGAYEAISEFAATDMMGSYAYHTIAGLDNGTMYSVKVTATDPATGFSVSKTESLATFTPGLIIHHAFETSTGGKVVDLVSSAQDSLVNASIAESGLGSLGNALSIEPSLLPGGIIDQASSLYLINSVIPFCTENVYNQNNTYEARINGFRYTENSYAFCFKNTNAEQARSGAALASFGGHGSNAVFLYNDSIGISTGNRFKTPGNTDVAVSALAPLASDNTEWNHAAYVFDHGMTKLYLNGNLVATIDDSDMYQFTDVQLRLNDNWASFNLGAVYSWNRSLSGTNLIPDSEYTNQFEGMIDEFRMYNYALTESEIAELADILVSRQDLPGERFVMYPNPANDMIHFSTPVNGKVSIFGMNGKQLLSRELSGESSINLSALTPGLYVIKLDTDQQLIVDKIQIIK